MRLYWWASYSPDSLIMQFYRLSELMSIYEMEIHYMLEHLSAGVDDREIESLVKSLLRIAQREDDIALKYLATRALGKIYFDRHIFLTALAQFEEALSMLDELVKMRDWSLASDIGVIEEKAKVHTLAGLAAYRLSEWKKACEHFSRALELMKRLGEMKVRNVKPLIGELLAFYADALAFLARDDAIDAYEEAHELLKEDPTPLFLLNAVKLFAMLVTRGYKKEAFAVLREAFENPFRAFDHMDLSMIRTLRVAYDKNVRAYASDLRVDEYEMMLGLVLASETLKDVFSLYCLWARIENGLSILIRHSRLTRLRGASSTIDFERNTYLSVPSYWTTRRSRRFLATVSLSALRKVLSDFRRVVLLSFFPADTDTRYNAVLLSLSPPGEFSHATFEVDSKLIAEAIDDPIAASEDMSSLLGEEIISKLELLTRDDLLVLSPHGLLHEMPWEALRLGGEGSHLCLRTCVVRVPSLHSAYLWVEDPNAPHSNLAFVASPPDEARRVRKLLKRRMLSVEDAFTLLQAMYYIDSFELLYYSLGVLSVSGDIPAIAIGELLIRADDEPFVELAFRAAILNTSDSARTCVDSLGTHSLPMCLYIGGSRAVIAVLGEVSDAARARVTEALYSGEKMMIARKMIRVRRELYSLGMTDCLRYVVYGDPRVKL